MIRWDFIDPGSDWSWNWCCCPDILQRRELGVRRCRRFAGWYEVKVKMLVQTVTEWELCMLPSLLPSWRNLTGILGMKPRRASVFSQQLADGYQRKHVRWNSEPSHIWWTRGRAEPLIHMVLCGWAESSCVTVGDDYCLWESVNNC